MGLFSWIFGKKKKEDIADKQEQKQEHKQEQERKQEAEEIDIFEKNAEPVSISKEESSKITLDAEKKKSVSGFFEIKKSKDDRYVFNLYAANKVIIATSQIYSSSQSAVNGANSVILNAEKASIEDQTLKEYTPQPFPKWEIYKDKGGQYRFRLSASNGSCVCHSQGYTSKASCKNGIESIIRTVKNAKIDKAYLKK